MPRSNISRSAALADTKESILFRTNAYAAEKQMIGCNVCGEKMNAIYSKAARTTCHECGGVACRDSTEQKQRAHGHVK